MKLALLLFGLSKLNYKHFSGSNTTCNYKLSYDNYQKYIFNYFQQKGYKIDIYFSTNKLSSKDREELINIYNPIAHSFTDEMSPLPIGKNPDVLISDLGHPQTPLYTPNNVRLRNNKIDKVVDLCLNSNNHYDLVLITRFDLLFQKDFNKSNINLDKFNLVSHLESSSRNAICDNFYLFPYKNLADFSKIIKKYFNAHWIKDSFANIYGEDHINFILDEKKEVSKLSFYKINRPVFFVMKKKKKKNKNKNKNKDKKNQNKEIKNSFAFLMAKGKGMGKGFSMSMRMGMGMWYVHVYVELEQPELDVCKRIRSEI